MDPKFLIGIAEIDAQHQEIHDVARSLIEAVESNDKWHIVHYILIRLSELLKTHFSVEECVMRIVAFPEVDAHKLVHQEILERVERLKNSSLKSDMIFTDLMPAEEFFFLSHILEHDKKFAEFVLANAGALIAR